MGIASLFHRHKTKKAITYSRIMILLETNQKTDSTELGYAKTKFLSELPNESSLGLRQGININDKSTTHFKMYFSIYALKSFLTFYKQLINSNINVPRTNGDTFQNASANVTLYFNNFNDDKDSNGMPIYDGSRKVLTFPNAPILSGNFTTVFTTLNNLLFYHTFSYDELNSGNVDPSVKYHFFVHLVQYMRKSYQINHNTPASHFATVPSFSEFTAQTGKGIHVPVLDEESISPEENAEAVAQANAAGAAAAATQTTPQPQPQQASQPQSTDQPQSQTASQNVTTQQPAQSQPKADATEPQRSSAPQPSQEPSRPASASAQPKKKSHFSIFDRFEKKHPSASASSNVVPNLTSDNDATLSSDSKTMPQSQAPVSDTQSASDDKKSADEPQPQTVQEPGGFGDISQLSQKVNQVTDNQSQSNAASVFPQPNSAPSSSASSESAPASSSSSSSASASKAPAQSSSDTARFNQNDLQGAGLQNAYNPAMDHPHTPDADVRERARERDNKRILHEDAEQKQQRQKRQEENSRRAREQLRQRNQAKHQGISKQQHDEEERQRLQQKKADLQNKSRRLAQHSKGMIDVSDFAHKYFPVTKNPKLIEEAMQMLFADDPKLKHKLIQFKHFDYNSKIKPVNPKAAIRTGKFDDQRLVLAMDNSFKRVANEIIDNRQNALNLGCSREIFNFVFGAYAKENNQYMRILDSALDDRPLARSAKLYFKKHVGQDDYSADRDHKVQLNTIKKALHAEYVSKFNKQKARIDAQFAQKKQNIRDRVNAYTVNIFLKARAQRDDSVNERMRHVKDMINQKISAKIKDIEIEMKRKGSIADRALFEFLNEEFTVQHSRYIDEVSNMIKNQVYFVKAHTNLDQIAKIGGSIKGDKALSDKYSKEVKEQTAIVNKLKKHAVHLQSEMTQTTQSMHSLKKRLEDALTSNTSLKSKLSDVQAHQSDMNSAIKQSNSTQKVLQKEREQHKATDDNLHQQLKSLTADNAKLSKKESASDSKATSSIAKSAASSAASQISATNSKAGSYSHEVDSLNSALSAGISNGSSKALLTHYSTAASTANQKLHEMRQAQEANNSVKHDETNASVKAAYSQVADYKSQIGKLTSQLKSERANGGQPPKSLRAELSKKSSAYSSLTSSVSSASVSQSVSASTADSAYASQIDKYRSLASNNPKYKSAISDVVTLRTQNASLYALFKQTGGKAQAAYGSQPVQNSASQNQSGVNNQFSQPQQPQMNQNMYQQPQQSQPQYQQPSYQQPQYQQPQQQRPNIPSNLNNLNMNNLNTQRQPQMLNSGIQYTPNDDLAQKQKMETQQKLDSINEKLAKLDGKKSSSKKHHWMTPWRN